MTEEQIKDHPANGFCLKCSKPTVIALLAEGYGPIGTFFMLERQPHKLGDWALMRAANHDVPLAVYHADDLPLHRIHSCKRAS